MADEFVKGFTKITVTLIVCATLGVAAYFLHLVMLDKNIRDEEVERIKVEKQHEIEATKQKKRYIWEREMDDE